MKIISFSVIFLVSFVFSCKQEYNIFDKILLSNQNPIKFFSFKNGELIENGISDTMIVLYIQTHPKSLFKHSEDLFLTVDYTTLNKFMAFRTKLYKVKQKKSIIFFDTIVIKDSDKLCNISFSITPYGLEKTREKIFTSIYDSTDNKYKQYYLAFGNPNEYKSIVDGLVSEPIHKSIIFLRNNERISKNNLSNLSESIYSSFSNNKFELMLAKLVFFSLANKINNVLNILDTIEKEINTCELYYSYFYILIETFKKVCSSNLDPETKTILIKKFFNVFKQIKSLDFHYFFLNELYKKFSLFNEISDEIKRVLIDYFLLVETQVKYSLENSLLDIPGYSINNFSILLFEFYKSLIPSKLDDLVTYFINFFNSYISWPRTNNEQLFLAVVTPKGIEGLLRKKYFSFLLKKGDTLSALKILKDYIFDRNSLQNTKTLFVRNILDIYLKSNKIDSSLFYLKLLYYYKDPSFWTFKAIVDSTYKSLGLRNINLMYNFDSTYFYPKLNNIPIIKTNKGVINFSNDKINYYFIFFLDDNCPSCNLGAVDFVKKIQMNNDENFKVLLVSTLSEEKIKEIFGNNITLSIEIDKFLDMVKEINIPDLIVIKDCQLIYHGMGIPRSVDTLLLFIK